MSLELILIRHGETAWNAVQRVQGQLDVPLNTTGEQQARAMAQALQHAGVQAIFSSDLIRTRQTAAPLEHHTQLRAHFDAALRERCYGVLEGLNTTQMRARYAEPHAAWVARTPHYAVAGGESLEIFQARIEAAMHGIAQSSLAQNLQRVAIVTHGGVLACVYRAAENIALSSPQKIPMMNASINRVLFSQGKFSVLEWGNVAHLPSSLDDV